MTTHQNMAILSVAALLAVTLGHVGTNAVSAASRCSLSPFGAGIRAEGVYMLGVTTGDTLLTGPGDTKPTGVGGHWGAGTPRQVFGQIVHVKRYSSVGVDDVPVAFAGGEVILVPWDYDSACEPVYWSGRAAWIEPGLEGFYRLRLRQPQQWIAGRPVADVFFADLSPYPHAGFYRAGYRGTDALHKRPSLTAEEYFSLHSSLPSAAEVRSRSAAAAQRLQQWETAHPDLANRYPADQLIPDAKRRLGASRLQ